ncbi:hypothetical protein J2Y68_003267 [Paenarthrobacter nitroguajacolicus]|nr:hypothetical protein [Paenarthrobacter nitroguajacolicus]
MTSGRRAVVSKDEVIRKLLVSGLADWVSLHGGVWWGTRGAINSLTKQVVLDVLHSVYSEGLMVPGELGETGFEDWALPSEIWVIRSELALDALEWRPMGEGFWLRLTPLGKALGHQHEAEGEDLSD